MCTKITT